MIEFYLGMFFGGVTVLWVRYVISLIVLGYEEQVKGRTFNTVTGY